MCCLLLAGCGGGGDDDERPAPRPAPKPPLALGITEGNPALIDPDGPKGFADARASLAALRPAYVRVLVDWRKYQPRSAEPPDFSVSSDGCSRGVKPCRETGGLRALFDAVRARQRESGGWQVLLSIYGTPDWAAAPPSGCERPSTTAFARMPNLEAYRAFLRALQSLGRETGVALPYWTPWNEPNHPAFLNPQRASCAPGEPASSPGLYARLVGVAQQELGRGQQLVLGDLAGYGSPRRHAASVQEFVAGLQPSVACAGSGPWGLHTYLGERPRGGRSPLAADPAEGGNLPLVGALRTALRAKGCAPPIWITEAGTFDHRCPAMAKALNEWATDRRVDAAFQFTFREDAEFPTGLVDASLRRTYRSYDAWKAYAGSPLKPEPPACAA